MIYTVTLNPSIDYIVRLEQLEIGSVNRMSEDLKLPGGKGINVSRILNRLGHTNTALGFLGGFTGQFIQETLAAEKMNSHFTAIADDTRINIKLKAQEETEINGQGPKLTQTEINTFLSQFELLKKGDVVILSGSLPPALPATFYADLITLIREKEADFVIDTTGEALLACLPQKPLLVKPNHHELAELFNTTFKTQEDLIAHARKLLTLGAQHVLISMAGDGALLVTPTAVYQSNVPKGIVKNSVGAGDSMIAGFTGTYLATHDVLEAFKWGLASGSGTAFSDDLATKEMIESLLPQIKITKLGE